MDQRRREERMVRATPELEYVPEGERKRVWLAAYWGACGSRSVWKAMGWYVVLVVLAQVALAVGFQRVLRFMEWPAVPGWGRAMVGGGVVCGVYLLVVYPVAMRETRRVLRERLGTHCVGCGYDLKGNESGVCPECGRRRGG